MQSSDLSLKEIKSTSFPDAYEEFLLDRNMNRNKYRMMLSAAALFLNSSDENVKRLGYRIIVIYCNRTKNYKPLYDYSSNTGIVPIAHYIDDVLAKDDEKNLYTEINEAFNLNYVVNNVYCTLKQKELLDFCNENQEKSLSIVAPTSYGKTDLIINTVIKNKDKKICVITPTKSLVLQTKARIIHESKENQIKVLTHPESYKKDSEQLIAVMTQERVLRLLKMDELLSFDYVIVDEAHELLPNNDRSILLATVIMLLSKRNSKTVFKMFTPFLCNASNIKVRYSEYSLKPYIINEYVKTEKIYIAELRANCFKQLSIYDQFLNSSFYISSIDCNTELTFVTQFAGNKNIVYFNKPKDIELFANALIQETNEVDLSDEIKKACKDIAEYVHPRYRLIECIKRGAIYHHGDVPEPVRMYIEKLYAEVDSIKYVVTSSTLLEGVNLPAEKMFILDNKKGNRNLSPSDCKNLIGRVCRFGYIFSKEQGSLKRLEPEVYFVVGEYFSKNANINSFLKNTLYVEKKVNDNMENVLLENTSIGEDNRADLKKANEYIENCEGGIVQEHDVRVAKTKIGKACFSNNITEIDILEEEERLDDLIEQFRMQNQIIDCPHILFDQIYNLFFINSKDNNLRRFSHVETRRFYEMFLEWRIGGSSLNQMIYSFLRYWKSLIDDNSRETLVYVGRWGDITRGGYEKLWTDISNKNDDELINLAIVRIKEEQDFLDNVLIKFVEVFNELEVIDESFYLLIKYGTNDKRVITCTRNGISLGLAKLLVEKYSKYLIIDTNLDLVLFRDGLLERMKENRENMVMVYELGYALQ